MYNRKNIVCYFYFQRNNSTPTQDPYHNQGQKWSRRFPKKQTFSPQGLSSLHISEHLREIHNPRNKDLRDQFTVLLKYRWKLHCWIYEILLKCRYDQILHIHFFSLHFLVQYVFPKYLAKFQCITTIRTHVFWTYISENLENDVSYSNSQPSLGTRKIS